MNRSGSEKRKSRAELNLDCKVYDKKISNRNYTHFAVTKQEIIFIRINKTTKLMVYGLSITVKFKL